MYCLTAPVLQCAWQIFTHTMHYHVLHPYLMTGDHDTRVSVIYTHKIGLQMKDIVNETSVSEQSVCH